MRAVARGRGWTFIEAAEGGCSILPLLLVEFNTPQDVAKARGCATVMSRSLAECSGEIPARCVGPLGSVADHDVGDARREGTLHRRIGAVTRLLKSRRCGRACGQLDGRRRIGPVRADAPLGEPVNCALHKLALRPATASFSVHDPSTLELRNTVRAASRGLSRVKLVQRRQCYMSRSRRLPCGDRRYGRAL